MPNGNKLYTYNRTQNITNPVITLPQTTTYQRYGNTVYQNQQLGMTVGGNTVTYYCITTFEIDSKDKIVFWRFDGNNCVSN